MRKRYTFLVFFFFSFLSLGFSETRVLDCDKIVKQMESMKEGLPVDTFDSNGDGKVDFMEKKDKDGKKIMEIFDFNHDGFMDDFYFYTNGIITLREVDSNFDRKVDIWVYIKDGHYITKYERDLDYDGTIDQVKTFGDKK